MTIQICGAEVKVQGKLVRIARVDGEGYNFVEKPEDMIEALRKSSSRIDLFTFNQKLSETSPKYTYPMEWDNFAAMSVSTFDQWWKKQINDKTRNMARRNCLNLPRNELKPLTLSLSLLHKVTRAHYPQP